MNEKEYNVNAAVLNRYREAIDTLARWCNEVDNPEISAGEQAVLTACYGAGLEIASIVTGASVEEVTADVRSAYRKYYKEE
jgi:hypothetical protein